MKIEKESMREKFFNVLRDVFCGKVKDIEGQSATVRLMQIKNKYYQHIEKHIEEELNNIVAKYPDFEEELYDKLYTFFHRYFTESGAITFASTPFHNNVYEKIYTNEKDVVLFWKTRDLYYIKTERVFRSMEFDYKDYRFYFDASNVEGKRGNEKRSVIFSLRQVEGKRIVFEVQYKEGNKDTNYNEILKELKRKGINLTEEDLDEVFSLYSRQADIDFFLHKRPREFLKEQFNLWLYQYLSEDHEWDLERLNQFNLLRRVAFKIIDFIAQFEEELVKIWLKPRFVLNSNYVITLDRIANKEGGIEIISRILSHPNIQEQIQEWRELNIVDENFKPEEILQEGSLNDRYKFLPIDTKYFKDLEIEILSLFDNLDEELDGWLIKSENFQALNTILPKFKGKVQTIYIDPPYNTGSDEFIYMDRYRHSTWLTMMENRLSLAKELMKECGVIFVSIASNLSQYNEVYRLGIIMEELFEKRIVDLIWKRREGSGSYVISGATEIHEYIMCFGKGKSELYKNILPQVKLKEYRNKDDYGLYKWQDLIINQYTKEERPNLFYGVIYNIKEDKLIFDRDFVEKNNEEVVIYPSKSGKSVWCMTKNSMKEVYERGVIKVFKDRKGTYHIKAKKYLTNKNGLIDGYPIKSILEDNDLPWQVGTTSTATKELKGLFPSIEFHTVKPLNLIKLLLYVSTVKDDIILDFFAGSGTTAHAVMKLNKEDNGKRKFILIEMADYFDTVIIPRIKKVAYSFNWSDGKPQDNDGIGVFCKYYTLEQFEDILSVCEYDEKWFENSAFMLDKKLLSCVEVEGDSLKVNPKKPYPNIDWIESISLLHGAKIKKIKPEYAELENGIRIEKDIKVELIKELIFWE